MEWTVFAILTVTECFYFIFHVRKISRKYQESVKRLSDDYQASLKIIRGQMVESIDDAFEKLPTGIKSYYTEQWHCNERMNRTHKGFRCQKCDYEIVYLNSN